jgi:hypothetical protein
MRIMVNVIVNIMVDVLMWVNYNWLRVMMILMIGV